MPLITDATMSHIHSSALISISAICSVASVLAPLGDLIEFVSILLSIIPLLLVSPSINRLCLNLGYFMLIVLAIFVGLSYFSSASISLLDDIGALIAPVVLLLSFKVWSQFVITASLE